MEQFLQDLCNKFNVTMSELIPRFAEYNIMKGKIGIFIGIVFIVVGLLLLFLHHRGVICNDNWLVVFSGAAVVLLTAGFFIVLIIGINTYEWMRFPEVKFFCYLLSSS